MPQFNCCVCRYVFIHLPKISFSSISYHTVESTQAVCHDCVDVGFKQTRYLRWTRGAIDLFAYKCQATGTGSSVDGW